MLDILFDIFELSHATAPALPSPAVLANPRACGCNPKNGGRNPKIANPAVALKQRQSSRGGREAIIRTPTIMVGPRPRVREKKMLPYVTYVTRLPTQGVQMVLLFLMVF